jgi:predicted RNase H-like nuclease
VDQWRVELAELVRRGRAGLGDDAVREGLADALELIGEAAPTPLRPPVVVLGVDGCKGGWVGVLVRPNGRTTLHTSTSIASLVEHIRQQEALGVVAIDMPIGLPDRNGREAEKLVRRELPGKTSSVFSTAPRTAYEAASYEDACRASAAASDAGTKMSRQAWALTPKIREVDVWVRSRPTVEVIEVHPELSFARMNGGPVTAGKKSALGASERRALLATVGITVPHVYEEQGFADDDLLDACAAAWSAIRFAHGLAESFPPQPEMFSDRIGATIRA